MDELKQLLNTMNVPAKRKYIHLWENILWLSRNLAIQNGSHPDFPQAIEIIKHLIREKNRMKIDGKKPPVKLPIEEGHLDFHDPDTGFFVCSKSYDLPGRKYPPE